MKIIHKKSIAWIMLSLYLMLSPLPLWSNGNMVLLCLEAGCNAGIVFTPQGDHCKLTEDSCRKSCGYEPQISNSSPDECFCCVEIPISKYIIENTPLSQPHDPSGSIQNVLEQSLPGSHPLLNKALFSPSPNSHILSTPKNLRSVILII